MNNRTPSEELFIWLSRQGYPEELDGRKVVYYFDSFEADLKGFEGETIKKLNYIKGKLWEKKQKETELII